MTRVSKVGVASANVDQGGGCVTADLDTLLIALYVFADDLLPTRHGPGRRPRITDAERTCLAVAQVLLDCPSERRFLRFARLGHLFPCRARPRARRSSARSSPTSAPACSGPTARTSRTATRHSP